MLLRLLPDQIAEYWDVFKYAISNSVPQGVDDSPETMNNILEALLFGKLVCWVSADIDEENNKTTVEGVLITAILEDDITKTRNLNIFTAFSFSEEPTITWDYVLEKLKQYGKGKGCNNLTGYTQDADVVNFALEQGGNADTRFIVMPLGKSDV